MTTSIGFIGFGKMGEAICRGILSAQLIPANQITFFDPSETRQAVGNSLGITHQSLRDNITNANIIIICVKPQMVTEVFNNLPATDISDKLFISILAGTPISMFESHLGQNTAICRVMPNTPALLGEGMAALCFNEATSDTQKSHATDIFNRLGKTIITTEEMMDTVTGISGSGPAFLYRIAHDIAHAGEQNGLSYQDALTLISQTFVGAGKMLQDSGKTPETLIADVSSPNGTTVAGLDQFDKTAIDTEIQTVIQAAINRSKELGQ